MVSTAGSQTELQRIDGLLAGRETVDGIPLDTEVRWLLIGHLAGEGKIGARRVVTAARDDPTDIGRRRAAACLAARPTPTAKAEAWTRIIEPLSPIPDDWAGVVHPEQSLSALATLMAGFSVGSAHEGGFMHRSRDPELLRPYVDRYVDALPDVWAHRTIDEAEAITELLYPRFLVDDAVVAAIDRALAGGRLPGAARRILKEGRDGTERAQRARRADID
jgi:aminopeptidase N